MIVRLLESEIKSKNTHIVIDENRKRQSFYIYIYVDGLNASKRKKGEKRNSIYFGINRIN